MRYKISNPQARIAILKAGLAETQVYDDPRSSAMLAIYDCLTMTDGIPYVCDDGLHVELCPRPAYYATVAYRYSEGIGRFDKGDSDFDKAWGIIKQAWQESQKGQ